MRGFLYSGGVAPDRGLTHTKQTSRCSRKALGCSFLVDP